MRKVRLAFVRRSWLENSTFEWYGWPRLWPFTVTVQGQKIWIPCSPYSRESTEKYLEKFSTTCCESGELIIPGDYILEMSDGIVTYTWASRNIPGGPVPAIRWLEGYIEKT